MKRLLGAFGLLGLILLLATPAFAQMKVIPGETIVKSVTVEAINASTREVTVKGPEGHYMVFTVSPEVKRFDALKVGDKISARYYENIILRVKRPGEKDVDTSASGITPGPGARPGGTAAEQRTITVTITQLDPKVPSITFTGPNNWTYSSRVQDPKAIQNVKVGDKLDITWTQAVLIDVSPASGK